MLTRQTRHKLVTLLLRLGQAEKQMEVLRESLCGQDHFEPYALFRHLDQDRKGYIVAENIHDFLMLHRIPHTLNAIMPVIQFYSLQEDGCLRYPDFMSMVLTTSNLSLRAIVTQRPTYDDHQLLSEVEYGFTRIIQMEMELFSKLNRDKFNLQKQDDFTIMLAFQSINYNKNTIEHEQLTNFLYNNEIHDEFISYCIFKRLDQNRDNVIDIKDFNQGMQPFEGLIQNQIDPKEPLSSNKDDFPTRNDKFASFQSASKSMQEKEIISYPNRRSMISIQKHVYKMKEVYQQRSPSTSKVMNRYSQSKENNKPKSQEELLYLVESLRIIIQLEQESEIFRENLSLQQDCNALSIFQCFDVDNSQKLCPSDVSNTLQQLDIHPSRAQIFLWVKRFDKDKDGKLNLNEFLDCLIPQGQKVPVGRQSRRKNVTQLKEIISRENQELLAQLFRCQIENEVAIECIRQKLNKRPTFNLKQLFQIIDSDQDGIIDLDDLRRVLEDNGIIIQTKQQNLLLQRFDKNNDGVISYAEFISEILPKSKQQF